MQKLLLSVFGLICLVQAQDRKPVTNVGGSKCPQCDCEESTSLFGQVKWMLLGQSDTEVDPIMCNRMLNSTNATGNVSEATLEAEANLY